MKAFVRSSAESLLAILLGFLLYNWVMASPDTWNGIRPVADLTVLWLMVGEPALALAQSLGAIRRKLGRSG